MIVRRLHARASERSLRARRCARSGSHADYAGTPPIGGMGNLDEAEDVTGAPSSSLRFAPRRRPRFDGKVVLEKLPILCIMCV